jgi:hypothetical protein
MREPKVPVQPKSGLPVTYEEAMVQLTMRLVEPIQHLLTGSAREYLATALRERLRRGLTDRQRVIDAVEAGDDLSHDVLMAEFHAMLDEGVMPPASLRAYAGRPEKHPKRGRGRVWYDDWRRNYVFVLLIALVAERLGLEATRNRSTEGPCGASLVATALHRLGFRRVSESRLANLWNQLGDVAIHGIALWRRWPELMPYVGMSGDPANVDWRAVTARFHKKISP